MAGRLLWWCPTSAVLGSEKNHLPGNAVVQTKTETADWVCQVACIVNLGFVLLTDLYWNIIFLPHWLSHLKCSWVLLPHPSHESINKAAKKLNEEIGTEFLFGYWWYPSVYLHLLLIGELRGTQVFWQAVALMCFICSILHNADNTVLCEKSWPWFF